MITSAELHRVADQERLRFDQAEKDYVILWVLSGLAYLEMMDHGWVFKGGTCLRHCYYKGYRFSEDIDFSLFQKRNRRRKIEIIASTAEKMAASERFV